MPVFALTEPLRDVRTHEPPEATRRPALPRSPASGPGWGRWKPLHAAALVGLVAWSTTAQAALNWGEFRPGACVAMGKRLYSSVLWGIEFGKSWEDTCRQTPATVNGVAFAQPDRCVSTGTNVWGEFHVPDSSCPAWGEAKKEFCSGSGLRQYSAVLWNIPAGKRWEDACAEAPIDINGVRLNAAACVSTGTAMWGRFNVEDPSCVPDEGQFVQAMSGNGFSDDCSRAVFKASEKSWKTDGCSVPLNDPATLTYKDSFYPSCVVHDYCYAMPWDGRRDQGKQICDGIQLREMRKVCKGWGANQIGCDIAADTWSNILQIAPQAAAAFATAQNHRGANPLPQCVR